MSVKAILCNVADLMDEGLKNPLVLNAITRMLKRITTLENELAQKKRELIFAKGQIAVYEKIFNEDMKEESVL